MNKKFEITHPYLINGNAVKEVDIVYPTFEEFLNLSNKAAAILQRGKKFEVVFRRERMKAYATLVDGAGNRTSPDDMMITNMPRPVAKVITDALDDEEHIKRGSVISDGDGISTSVIFKLGAPVKLPNDDVIEELEFIANNYGDVEDIWGEDGPLDQALALIKKIALPVGIKTKLLALPSTVISQINLGDGFEISQKVLPRFL